MSEYDPKIGNANEHATRKSILEQTGYRLTLLFPRLPEETKDQASYDNELLRLTEEFGESNVFGREVLEEVYGKVCVGLFVEQNASRRF